MFIGQTGCWTSEWPSFLGLFGHASSRSRKPPSPQRLPLPFEALDASIRGRPSPARWQVDGPASWTQRKGGRWVDDMCL